MASGIIEVVLNRDAASTSWGFRLHGGKDIGFPLVIQRVFMGSPAEGGLQRGDTILQVQGRDSADMTHMDAHDLIKSAGTRLQLLIRRLPGAPLTPTSPLPSVDGMHPYAKLLRETEASRSQPKAFQPMSPPCMTPQPPRKTPQPPPCFSPLPTTNLGRPHQGGMFAPTPKNQADAELMGYRQEKYKELDAVTNQGYRTLPLIAPGPKTRHDIPMGSYLRHTPDPNWKGRSTIQPTLPKFGYFPTPTYSTIGHYRRKQYAPPPPGAPMFERPIDEGSQLVHHQYNSPMFLYSQRNIDQTIQDQTGLDPAKPKVTVGNPTPTAQSGPLSPGIPGNLAPARPGTKFTNIVDITLSPTFQMIQESENRSQSPMPEVRTQTLPRRAPGPKPYGEMEAMNAFGVPKEVIHQSGSFKTLMTSLYAPPEQAKLKLTVDNPAPPSQSGSLSPSTPVTLVPAKPGTKLTNILELALSPTFQMIQKSENRSKSQFPDVRAHTLPRRAPKQYDVEPRANSPWPKGVIHQSESFKTLMTALYAPPKQKELC